MADNELHIYEDIEKCIDSMLFDSGTQIATYGTPDDHVSLDVWGEVRVSYDGETFRRASDMPQELLDKFKGDYWDDDEIYIGDNNWFSVIHVVDGEAQPDDVVVDGRWKSEDELVKELKELLDYFQKG